MNDIEKSAVEHFQRSEWREALECFEKLLSGYQNGVKNNFMEEKIVTLLIAKSECNLALGRAEDVIQDCRRILNLINSDINGYQSDRIKKLFLKSLLLSERYNEVISSINGWLVKGNIQPETKHAFENLLQRLSGNDQSNTAVMEEGINVLDLSFNEMNIAGNHVNDGPNTATAAENTHENGVAGNGMRGDHVCSYCALRFYDAAGLRAHCQTSAHQMVIMSDEGRDWKYRPPPRGLTADAYSLCENFVEREGNCRCGERCVDAHGEEELAEWRERFEYRRMKMQRASEKQLYGKSYTEQLLEKWITAGSPEEIMREKVDGVDQSISGDLVTSVSSKNSQREWTFLMKTSLHLKAVALLHDAHRNHFSIRQVSTGDHATVVSGGSWKPSNDQEWTSSLSSSELDEGWNQEEERPVLEHRVRVGFKTEIYGTFRQSVVFDFGGEPVLVKHLCVDVVPVTDIDKIKEIQKEVVVSAAERWCAENAEIIPFLSVMQPYGGASVLDAEKERLLLESYPTPRPGTFTLTHSTVLEKSVTKNNYRDRMHELLFVEEMARYDQVARYNVSVKLQIVNCYFLTPNGVANSTAKYAHNGELFALMRLGKVVSEDTSAGRLILNNCSTIFISFSTKPEGQKRDKGKLVVYEAVIEDKGKSMIYLRLSAETVAARGLRPDTMVPCQVQFQLNRVPYCEWHYAIDRIADYRLIFPDTCLEPSIPWSPHRQWGDILDSKLNSKQREAIVAITSPALTTLPPILIIGPFGTGKTYTLSQAIKFLMTQPDTRVLVCTHSNSAADLYIKDYLHPHVEAGHEEARPLRIYYHKRWVATVNSVVQKYCLIEMVNGTRAFKKPCLEDIMKHRIVVVTLSISMYLSSLGLKKGHFTHILLDEAAQAMECEAIMPLAMANENTRIVLAGDHMQLSPELFSQFAKERNLHVSLLERLYDHYPSAFPCKILLCENYRAHEAIINFTSELFYDQKLVSSGKQPRHDKFYPLTFFTTRGEDVQDVNSTAFFNNSEVYEVVERVCELRKKWPSAWGKLEDQSIGIMTPYADQVFRIRSELRKRRLGSISVERVLNVQGKQFRAIFLSTVRTRRTCLTPKDKVANELDFGFLSNWKLLNTAITRAQSLVAVVGDPVALCSIGRCRKVWERFLEICNDNKSLFGITWSLLRTQLDGVELKKNFTLNPLAPEFVPRSIQGEAYIKLPPLIPGVGPGMRPMLPPPQLGFPLLLCPPPPNFPGPLLPQPSMLPFRLGAPNPWPPFPQQPVKKEEPKQFLPTSRSPGMLDMMANMDRTENSQGMVMHPPPQPLCIRGRVPDARVPPRLALMGGGLDKAECIQFLNNVHFPERPPPPPHQMSPDWRALLPPNTTLAEILESQALQMDWYLHLATTVSLEIAEKFKDLIVRANEKPATPVESQVPANRLDHRNDMDRGSKPMLLREIEANIMSFPNAQNPEPHPMAGAPLVMPPQNMGFYQRQPPNREMEQQFMGGYQEQAMVVRHPSASQHYLNDFHLNGREQEIDEPASSRHNVETTYASVVRAQPPRSSHNDESKHHPMGILRGFNRASSLRGNNGFYQYFS